MFRKRICRRDASGHAGYADPSYPVTGPAHGHTIAQVIEHTSENALEVEQGLALSGAASPRRPRIAFVRVGSQREQSQGEVLSTHCQRPKTSNVETSRWRTMARAIGLILGDPIE